MDTAHLLTTRQVAHRLGLSIRRVNVLAQQGRLRPAIDWGRAGKARLYHPHDVDRFAALPRDPGAPNPGASRLLHGLRAAGSAAVLRPLPTRQRRMVRAALRVAATIEDPRLPPRLRERERVLKPLALLAAVALAWDAYAYTPPERVFNLLRVFRPWLETTPGRRAFARAPFFALVHLAAEAESLPPAFAPVVDAVRAHLAAVAAHERRAARAHGRADFSTFNYSRFPVGDIAASAKAPHFRVTPPARRHWNAHRERILARLDRWTDPFSPAPPAGERGQARSAEAEGPPPRHSHPRATGGEVAAGRAGPPPTVARTSGRGCRG